MTAPTTRRPPSVAAQLRNRPAAYVDFPSCSAPPRTSWIPVRRARARTGSPRRVRRVRRCGSRRSVAAIRRESGAHRSWSGRGAEGSGSRPRSGSQPISPGCGAGRPRGARIIGSCGIRVTRTYATGIAEGERRALSASAEEPQGCSGHIPLPMGVTQTYALGGFWCVGSEQHFLPTVHDAGAFGLHWSRLPAS